MSILSILNSLSNQKGINNENRVERIFKDTKKLPDWFLKIEKTPKSFPLIDFVIHTDIGPIYLQIKSSKKGKEVFKDKAGNKSKYIACVIIKSSDSDELIKQKILSSVNNLRVKFRK